MKMRFLVGLLATAAVPGVIWGSEGIVIGANVAKFCQFNTVPTFDNPINTSAKSLGVSASTIIIDEPTSPTGLMQTWRFSMKISGTCNHSSEVKLTTLRGGLIDETHTGTAFGFVNRFDYRATAAWDSAGLAELVTTGVAGASSSPPPSVAKAPHIGNVEVHVTALTPLPTSPVMAGAYSDILMVTLTPQ
jgi:hypothetical protein